MAMAGERAASADQRDVEVARTPVPRAKPAPPAPFGNAWGSSAPIIATAVTAGPIPVEPVPTRSPPADAAEAPRSVTGGQSPAAAARERAATALRMLRERSGEAPVRPTAMQTPIGGRDRPAGQRPPAPLTDASESPGTASASVPPENAPTAPLQSNRATTARPTISAGPTDAGPVSVRSGEPVRIDLAEATGCALRGTVAYWPSAMPDWLALDRVSGTLSGTAPAGEAIVPVAVIASNGRGATATLSLTLAVESADAEINRREAAEAWHAVESAMRSTLDAIPALRERIEAGSRSGRIRLRAS